MDALLLSQLLHLDRGLALAANAVICAGAPGAGKADRTTTVQERSKR
jgi:hypothetical protein